MTFKLVKSSYLMLGLLVVHIIFVDGNWYDSFHNDYEVFTKRSIRRNSSINQLSASPGRRNNTTRLDWIEDALNDIAYYLRAYKFNEYDRRYQKDTGSAPREYYEMFPKPPLRSLHWEVHQFCDVSFLTCVEYLNRKIKKAGLKRIDDTTTVILEQNWNLSQNAIQIETLQSECLKMLAVDDIRADPFDGPLERFQWRTTASYYMCWYTMNEVLELQELKGSCDNFANCLDPKHGVHNRDPRTTENEPFSCALYSFCPDPCCPIKHISKMEECWNSNRNPCYAGNSPENRQCSLNRTLNTDLTDIILNRWNVSCKCPYQGYEWDSKYGMCIDKDECVTEIHSCDLEREACVNLQGSFTCACRWGFVWRAPDGPCEASPALDIIKLHNIKPVTEKTEKLASSLVKMIYNRLFEKSSCSYKIIFRNLIAFICFFEFLVF